VYLELEVRRVDCRHCGGVKREQLDFDEISTRKGHTYRIVVSDLIRGRPIRFGGEDRSEASLAQFYQWLGPRETKQIRLAVMDMWKAFEKATRAHAPQAAIVYDKFHVMRHPAVRRAEYARLSGKQRRYIKGQRYALLSRRENLTLDGRKALKQVLAANRRLNKAYVLKESFGQLWGLPARGLGQALFRQLEGELEVATAQTLREVRRDGRAPLGWHRGVPPAREQGLARRRGRSQQQTPCHPAPCIRTARRGVLAAEDPHLHAPAALKSWKYTHTTSRRPR
jgi:transposase